MAHNQEVVRCNSHPRYVFLNEVIMETENCVVCGVDTKVPRNLHIDLRYHYVEGSGQLCKECWDVVYERSR